MSKRKSTNTLQSGANKRADDKAIVTIAIDFGTAGTGYAYCFAGSDMIEAKQPGGQEPRKTLTNLLLNPDGSFKAFGFDARRIYSESTSGDFFSNYKMLLSNVGGRYGGVAMAKALNGKRVPLIDVIKQTLLYVKGEALKECGRALPNGLTASECQWVVTVPAIWADEAKGFMRTAAYKAGLIASEDSRRLILALEPESAAIACDVVQLVKPGHSFMVLDCGGGTVDITLNRLQSASPLRLDEVAAPSGGPWGSTFIDGRFEEFVKDLVGERNLDAVKATPYWIELLENWEGVKTSQSMDDAPRTVNFSPLLEVLDEGLKLSDMVAAFNTERNTSLKMRGRSTIVMDATFVRDLFKPTTDKIIDHCRHLMEEHPVDFIFLVGGFAESDLLKSTVISHFDSHACKVVVPVRPGLAVLRGAVQFGMNHDVFASRIARFTYGLKISQQYQPGDPVHDRASLDKFHMLDTPTGKKKYVRGLFAGLVKVGDKLAAGHKAVKNHLSAVAREQTAVCMSIYATPVGSIDFTTDRTARQVGLVTIPCTPDQSISLQLEFGATEILASAYNEDTGQTAEAKLRYD